MATSPNEFVVANDESNVLFTYRLGESKSIRSLDLTRFLDVGRNQEADIEGAAAIGSRIYWITSHGRNSKDRTQASRYRLFATERRDDSAQAGVGKPYKHLLQDLTDAPQLARYHLAAASKLAAEADGGLNIEGLAATPDGQLLIGFRNPLPDERALVVPLENPTEVVDGKRAKLGEAYEFNLGRRGVRSIEWVDGRYLIVAGPTGDEGSFALYRWSGKRDDVAEPIDGIDLGSLRPEALFAVPTTANVVTAERRRRRGERRRGVQETSRGEAVFSESARYALSGASLVRTDARRSRRRPLRAGFAAADTYRMHRTPLGQRVQRFRFAAYLWLALVLCAAAREADPSWLPWLCAALLPVFPWLLRAARAMFGAAVDDAENLFTPFVVALLGLPPLPSVATIGALLTGVVAQFGWRGLARCGVCMAAGWCAGALVAPHIVYQPSGVVDALCLAFMRGVHDAPLRARL